VPLTFATQVAVCVVLIEEGVAITETPVTAAGIGVAAVLMVAVPDLVPSCADVAVQVPEPGPDGVKTPAWVMVPPVAVQFTAEL
jgi:hypothetical protein